jgi:hypothetical protein
MEAAERWEKYKRLKRLAYELRSQSYTVEAQAQELINGPTAGTASREMAAHYQEGATGAWFELEAKIENAKAQLAAVTVPEPKT